MDGNDLQEGLGGRHPEAASSRPIEFFSDRPLDAAYAQSWLDLQCACIPRVASAALLLRTSESDVFQGVATWPDETIRRDELGALAERALNARQLVVERERETCRIALPIRADGTQIGAVVVEIRVLDFEPFVPDAIVDPLQVGIGWMVTAYVGHQLQAEKARTRRLAVACEAIARLNRHRAPIDAALDLVNWLLEIFECTRVSIGLRHDDHIRLLAVSHSAWFDPRSQVARSIESAMDEALDQRRGVSIPTLPRSRTGLAIAHRDLAGANAVISTLLAGVTGHAAGVVLMERDGTRPFSVDEAALLEQSAAIAGPLLETKANGNRWVGGRVTGLTRRVRERLVDPRRPALRMIVIVAVAVLLALPFLESEWRITADAFIEGREQRALAAPFDGFVFKANAKAGETVTQGQALAELDRRSLRLEYQRFDSESSQHERRYSDALAKHERSSAGLELAAMQEADAHRNLVQDKLDRSVVTAPFDAVVVSGDLSQQIGTPVEQGKVLFELAPLDAYRVILKVDEHDIRGLRVGQQGRVVLAGLSADALSFVVRNISVAEPRDGRNVFRVEASLDRAEPRLRPGMQGVGKIDAGRARLVWIWTHAAWDWLTLQLWKWWP